MKSQICQNCSHFKGCLYLNSVMGNFPIHCEMHETDSEVKIELNGHKNTVVETKFFLNDGEYLCATCVKSSDCNWRKENDFVFDCEDYE